ncbi:hypothetical protein L195_g063046, partial [Trifolium pratense]
EAQRSTTVKRKSSPESKAQLNTKTKQPSFNITTIATQHQTKPPITTTQHLQSPPHHGI